MPTLGPYVIRDRLSKKFWGVADDGSGGAWKLSKLDAIQFATKAEAEKAERAIQCGRANHWRNEIVPFDSSHHHAEAQS
jgi:hypothetical protein